MQRLVNEYEGIIVHILGFGAIMSVKTGQACWCAAVNECVWLYSSQTSDQQISILASGWAWYAAPPQ